MIMSSANAADITLTKSNETNFKYILETATNNSVIELNNGAGEFSLNPSNVNIAINKTITIQSSNPSQNTIINLNSKVEHSTSQTLEN